MDQTRSGMNTPPGTTRASEIDDSRSTTDQVKNKAREAGQRAAERIESQASKQKERATGELGAIASALREAGDRLDRDNMMSSRLVQAAADKLDDLSTSLDNRDIGEMVSEVRRWGRRNPGAFIGAAVAVGFLASRFLKASEDDMDEYDYDYDRGYDNFSTREGLGTDRSTDRNFGYGAEGSTGYGTGTTGTSGSGLGSTGMSGATGTAGTTGNTPGSAPRTTTPGSTGTSSTTDRDRGGNYGRS